MDDFSKLEPTKHMLEWLADEPFDAIRNEVQRILQQQVPGSRLKMFRVESEPQWLTGARPGNDDTDKAILVRTGVAFEFTLIVQEPNGQTHKLQGTYSWVGANLDDPYAAKQRLWLDLGTTLETHGSKGELMARMYFD
jgi:hypothetical protein